MNYTICNLLKKPFFTEEKQLAWRSWVKTILTMGPKVVIFIYSKLANYIAVVKYMDYC